MSLRVGVEDKNKYVFQDTVENCQGLYHDAEFDVSDKNAGYLKSVWIHLNDLYTDYTVLGSVLQPIIPDTNNTLAKALNVLIKVCPQSLRRLFE